MTRQQQFAGPGACATLLLRQVFLQEIQHLGDGVEGRFGVASWCAAGVHFGAGDGLLARSQPGGNDFGPARGVAGMRIPQMLDAEREAMAVESADHGIRHR